MAIFTYQSIDYSIDDCPTYPLQSSLIDNKIASQFSDGYITTRPRITPNLHLYTLNFEATKEDDKLKIQAMEELTGCSDIFIWTPEIKIEPRDEPTIQSRHVRLTAPIKYELISYGLWRFTMNLQEAGGTYA